MTEGPSVLKLNTVALSLSLTSCIFLNFEYDVTWWFCFVFDTLLFGVFWSSWIFSLVSVNNFQTFFSIIISNISVLSLSILFLLCQVCMPYTFQNSSEFLQCSLSLFCFVLFFFLLVFHFELFLFNYLPTNWFPPQIYPTYW